MNEREATMSVSWYTYPTLWRFERIFDDAKPEIVVTLYRYSGRFGRNGYERLRARAMVLTMRYTGLRIGDVAMLAKDRVSRDGARWRIFLHTEMTGKPVFLPIADELRLALNVVPNPPIPEPLPKPATMSNKEFRQYIRQLLAHQLD